MPDRLVLFPVPVIAPGFTVQFPAGKPERTILPVPISQVGCVMLLTTGAEGEAE